MSIEETTVTEYDPYSPPIATRQPKKAKISKYMKTPLRYLNNGKPFLLKSPQTSLVPQNNMFSPSEMVHDTDFINNHENVADKKENMGNSHRNVENETNPVTNKPNSNNIEETHTIT